MSQGSRPHAGRYDYPVDECDVVDKARLARFREKRDEWLGWLYDDELHAIDAQISGLLWTDATFRLVNASRRHAHEAGGPFATLNGDIARLIDMGYLHQQLSGLRRLMEPASNNPKRQIISLRRLLDDVREHHHLITREVFVCLDGLPFEYAEGQQEDIMRRGPGVHCWPTKGPKAWDMSESMHDCFDGLRGQPGDRQNREEPVGLAQLDRADAILDAAPFATATILLNKTIAHAADPVSRHGAPLDGIPFKDLWTCQKALLQAAVLVSGVIGASKPGGLPIAQYDVSEAWDAPFAPADGLDAMIREWDQENEERARWADRE